MTTVEALQREIRKLNRREFAELRDWLLALDGEAWDRQLERDVAAGRLDNLGKKALEEHAAGRTTPL